MRHPTPAQLLVITQLAEGYTNDETAEHLGLAPTTVKTQVQDAIRRTHSRNRTHLVVRWVRGEFDEVT